MATLPSAIPETVDIFEFRTSSESRKTSTVTRTASLPSTIPLAVDIFEFRTPSESRETSTVTRMVTLAPAIPVTVDTFRIQESKHDDSYKETRGRGRAKPWKKKVEPNLWKKTLRPKMLPSATAANAGRNLLLNAQECSRLLATHALEEVPYRKFPKVSPPGHVCLVPLWPVLRPHPCLTLRLVLISPKLR